MIEVATYGIAASDTQVRSTVPLNIRAQPHGFRGVMGSFRISPGRAMSDRETAKVQGTEPDCIFPMLDRFAILLRKSQAVAEMRGRRCGIWIELKADPLVVSQRG